MIQKAKVAKAFISVIALFAFVYWGLDRFNLSGSW